MPESENGQDTSTRFTLLGFQDGNASIVQIDLSRLDLAEHDLRAELDDEKMDALDQDIAHNGLYYPLLVKPKGERFEVVDGGRRFRVLEHRHWITAPCIVMHEGSPPPEAVKLKTNLLREDNTDAEIAVWLGELVNHHGYNMDQLCQVTGRKEAWINERWALLNGDGKVLEALGKREINFSQAKALNSCKDQGWRNLGLEYAIRDKIPAERLKQWLVTNTLASQPVALQPESQALAAIETVPLGPGIVCEWCGGSQDPHNMVNVWMHRWEWALVLQIRGQYMVPKEGA